MNDNEYRDLITTFINERDSGNNPQDKYFIGHLPRFLLGKRLIDKYVTLDSNSIIMDCGTNIPYQTLYLAVEKGCNIYTCSLDTTNWKMDKVSHEVLNICLADFGIEKYDLVILTEVLEHLPTNLYKVRDKIIKSIKKGGYLLCSFPLKGYIEHPYDYEYPVEELNISHGNHLREFTEDKAKEFIEIEGLQLLDKEKVFTKEYDGYILVCLLRRIVK
jgi:hypothetical protein